MRKHVTFSLVLLTAALAGIAQSSRAGEFADLFDGKSLDGWKGAEGFWRVENGTIVGETTEERPTNGNTFLVWQGGDVSDFEFECEVRWEGNNSGVQYRSSPVDEAGVVLSGYQADLHPKPEYFGMLYGEKLAKRGIMANRHQRVVFDADGKKEIKEQVTPTEVLNPGDWNTLRIVAVGNRLVHLVNGIVSVDIEDNATTSLLRGKLGLQLHAGPPMKAEFRKLRYRAVEGGDAKEILSKAIAAFPKPEKKAAQESSFDWILEGTKPAWVWRTGKTDNEPIYLRKEFLLSKEAVKAKLYASCDNEAEIWLNGKHLGRIPDWGMPMQRSDLASFLKKGINTISVKAKNRGGIAAFVCKVAVEQEGAESVIIASSKDWSASADTEDGWHLSDFDDSSWNLELKEFGSLGVKPWGLAGKGAARASGGPALAEVSDMTIAKDFAVDFLYEVPGDMFGSWVAICNDGKGGFYVCDQRDKGLFHVSVSGKKVEVTPVSLTIPGTEKLLSGAQGLLWAFDSLWFHQNGGPLFRLSDSDGDGALDLVEPQPSSGGGGEHGNHSLVLDETGEGIYLVSGNGAPEPPADAVTRSRVQGWSEDHLLPRMWDARGHARGKLAPGGWISRFDPKTKSHDLISMGFRNQYDAALNSAGDLFAYDADMEWDMGNYWYRPTRINFAVSGSDHGWRSGTGKWPTYYEDSLPPLVEIGPGSPTGFVAGTGAKFPERYQRALYAFDWTFGSIWAIHPEQNGAGYTADKELFVAGVPLPVTDGIVGSDGHLYFLVGGRGTQSGLYRVRYDGTEKTVRAPDLKPTPDRAMARALEKFHGREDASAVSKAWEHLSSPDRYLRHAARVAIESQPVASWSETEIPAHNIQGRITRAVALARKGEASHQERLVKELMDLNYDEMDEEQQLGLLRALSLTFIRLGAPSEEQRVAALYHFSPRFPSPDADVTTELIRMLVYLQCPDIVEKTMELISHRAEPEVPDWAEIAARNSRYGSNVKKFLVNAPPSREVYYVMMLASAQRGWTLDLRRQCIELLNEAGKGSGGASFPGFLANIRAIHLGSMSNEERAAIADISGESFNPVPDFDILPPEGPGEVYTLESASKHLNFRDASFERGRSLFFSTSCGACHRLGGLGGDVGPDLTSVPNKFDSRYVLEAIIDPSRDISDQYGMFEIEMNDGTVSTGLFVENGDEVSVYPPDHTAEPKKVKRSQVKSVKQLAVSQMPPGLINSLNPSELKDLMAYLMAGGDPENRVYTK